jgi:hypothetical protein
MQQHRHDMSVQAWFRALDCLDVDAVKTEIDTSD